MPSDVALSHSGASCENGASSHDRRILAMSVSSNQATALRKWMCVVCGYIYDEAEGVPEEGIATGTRWEDVPDTWTCPDCGTTKDDFEMIELD
jgi:rubredoxin